MGRCHGYAAARWTGRGPPAPRIQGAKLVSIESINAGDNSEDTLRGRQFAALQEYLQVAQNVVVDIGASNVEDLLLLMSRYRGSHQDFDFFVVPTVPATKQQQDTIATLVALARLGVPADAVRLVFNMLDEDSDIEREFKPLRAFLDKSPLASATLACRLNTNEIYGLVNGAGVELSALADDQTDFKGRRAPRARPAAGRAPPGLRGGACARCLLQCVGIGAAVCAPGETRGASRPWLIRPKCARR